MTWVKQALLYGRNPITSSIIYRYYTVKNNPYTYGYFVASFPYFNGTGSDINLYLWTSVFIVTLIYPTTLFMFLFGGKALLTLTALTRQCVRLDLGNYRTLIGSHTSLVRHDRRRTAVMIISARNRLWHLYWVRHTATYAYSRYTRVIRVSLRC